MVDKWLTPFPPSHTVAASPSVHHRQPLPLAEARLSQVEAELRLMLVETEVSRLEERLSHLEAELADVRNARADDAPPISPMLAAPPDAPSDYL
jgi:hypothetical protein